MWEFWRKKETSTPKFRVCKECRCLFESELYSDYCSLDACNTQRLEREKLERREQDVVAYVKANWRDFEKQVKRKKEVKRKAYEKMSNEYPGYSNRYTSTQLYAQQNMASMQGDALWHRGQSLY